MDVASRPLEDFVSRPVIVRADDPISEIIGKIITERLNEVLVDQDSKYGIVTLRSILRAGEVSDRKASTLSATPPVTTLTDPVSKAASIMSSMRVRSLPVLDSKGQLKGIVSSSDFLRELAGSSPLSRAVSDIMTFRPVTIESSDRLDKARSIMVDRDFDHLPVTHNGNLAGLVTSLDMITVMGPTEKRGRTSKLPEPSSKGIIQVGGILREPPVTSNPSDDSFEVLRNVLDKGRTCSTIVSNGAIVGIVTLRDYVRLLSIETGPGGPPVYVVGLPSDDFESSQAEAKFRRSIGALTNVYPAISEARAIVKTSSGQKDRKRFEVQVLVRAPGEQFDFTEEGWSIAEVFEKVGEKTKRLITKPKDHPSHHRRPSRGEIESSRYSE